MYEPDKDCTVPKNTLVLNYRKPLELVQAQGRIIGLYNHTVGSGVVWLASGTARTSVPSLCVSGLFSPIMDQLLPHGRESGHRQLQAHSSQLPQLKGKAFLFLVSVGKCWRGMLPYLGPVLFYDWSM